ncbi:hypothetical protein BBW65_07405 [Helicobacter enhydrae]|uniref:Riboflavin biosynthesis protein n=2 Tax=Helicobacter enhydrae TaxID=222136 RepID=A0A1B1U778_9HELI|nr:hypothetical protein BBW65_07405 [Helicobacter enhydrae]
MKNISSISPNPSVHCIGIGKFDGFHLAHLEIFKRVLQSNAGTIVFITPKTKRRLLTPNPKGLLCDFFDCAIAQNAICLPLNQIEYMDCDAFVELLKRIFPALQKIVVGYDFRFGKDRAHSINELEAYFEVEVVEQMLQDGVPIHSQRIIKNLEMGEIEVANRLLGREYMIGGEVISGQGRGALEFVPTLNLKCEKYVLPQSGVYATWSEWGGVKYPSVSFLGHRISTDGEYAVETHVLDRVLSCQPKDIKIFLVQKIRENQRFENLSMLKARILEDIKEAGEILSDQTLPQGK